ncbi:hypothetical protein TNCV_4788861 [Trichonephila clavipes]|nr:hypothetical protein TNCV_4788861 [Trichonephila clavipes]
MARCKARRKDANLEAFKQQKFRESRVAFEECYYSQCFKCEEYLEKLSDSQEKLPVTKCLRSRCIPLRASEPQLQLGSDRL